MFRYHYDDYDDQDSNYAFTMGNEKPTSRGRVTAALKAAESVYKREIQDLVHLIRQLKSEQKNLADHPSTDTQTTEITNAIDSGAYVSKEIEMGVQIRDLEQKLASARKKFQFLFGDNH